MNRDLKSNVDAASSLVPLLKTASANGTGVDLKGYDSAMVLFHCGANTDGTHTPSVEESDSSGSGYTAVAAADLQGSLVAMVANSVQRVGYIGAKRYIRAVMTITGSPATGAATSAVVARGNPHQKPLA